MMQGILKVAISLELFSMGSMIWKWDQGVIDDLSCLFYWRPGVFLLELIGCCCPNLYLPFIHFLQPLQLDKRGNWLFFLAERETTHKRAVAAFLLTFNHPDEKSNFPVNFCEKTFQFSYQTLLESFIEVFMGRHDCEREWYTTSSET